MIPTATTPGSPDPTLPDVGWLDALPHHPVFASAAPGVASRTNAAKAVAPRRNLVAARSTDIVVAVGNELRIASLLSLKRIASTADTTATASDPRRATAAAAAAATAPYVRLTSPCLDFAVHDVVLSPTGRLCAVVGRHSLAVVVLPRASLVASAAAGAHPSLPVKAARVGAYYHHAHAGVLGALAVVRWHPLAVGGTSLVALTRDGILREYDTAADLDEPTQVLRSPVSAAHRGPPQQHRARFSTTTTASPTATFRPSRSRTPLRAPRRGTTPARDDVSDDEGRADVSRLVASLQGLATDDEGSQIAASFAFGCEAASAELRGSSGDGGGGDTDDDRLHTGASSGACRLSAASARWHPLTLYVVMQNGDLWAVCPFLPSQAALSASYLHRLSAFSSQTSPGTRTTRYLSALLRDARPPASRSTPASTAKTRRKSTPSLTPSSLRDVTPASAMDMSPDVEESDEDAEAGTNFDRVVVRPPSHLGQPCAQGPFLLTPAPHELSEEREAKATDLAVLRMAQDDSGAEERATAGVDVLCIVSDDGRVDVGLLLESIAPRWHDEATARNTSKSATPKRAQRPGRYGLSDTDSDDDVDGGEEAAMASLLDDPSKSPSLFVYETIDLGLLASLQPVVTQAAPANDTHAVLDRLLAAHRPSLSRDPLYADTIYVQHLGGVHALCLGPWARRLLVVLAGMGRGNEAYDAREDAAAADMLRRFAHRSQPTDVRSVIQTPLPSADDVRDAMTAATPARRRPLAQAVTPVCGLAIVSDAYLSYSLLALTVQHQAVGVELHLRTDAMAGIRVSDAAAPPRAVGLEEAGGSARHQAYVSLLADAFRPPPPFDAPPGTLPVQPRLAPRGAAAAELKVTPATLRELGTAVAAMRQQLRDVVQGGNAVQARLELQMREMARQLGRLADIGARAAAMRGEWADGGEGGAGRAAARLRRAVEAQRSLAARADRVLQRLMDAHQPRLSVYEEQWFGELRWLRDEVGGSSVGDAEWEGVGAGGRTDGKGEDEEEEDDEEGPANKRGLTARVDKLDYQFSLLRPELRALASDGQRRAAASRTNGGSSAAALGSQQLSAVEKLLGHESEMLLEARSRVQSLAAKLSRTGVRTPLPV